MSYLAKSNRIEYDEMFNENINHLTTIDNQDVKEFSDQVHDISHKIKLKVYLPVS